MDEHGQHDQAARPTPSRPLQAHRVHRDLLQLFFHPNTYAANSRHPLIASERPYPASFELEVLPVARIQPMRFSFHLPECHCCQIKL